MSTLNCTNYGGMIVYSANGRLEPHSDCKLTGVTSFHMAQCNATARDETRHWLTDAV